MRNFLVCLIVCFILGCKSTQTLTSESALNPKLKAKQIIKAHNKQKADFLTLQSRLKIELIEDDKSQTHTVTLRMERDKVIWINAFLNMVRLKVTPEKVQMYNKLDRTYFDGDFTLIKDFLGVELSFYNLQNLLLGDAMFDYRANTLEKKLHNTSYALSPKQQHTLFDVLYLINPSYFKMDAQELSQPANNRTLKVHYLSFQELEQQILPQKITIKAIENQRETSLKLNLKSLNLNQPIRFPFSIPSGFKAIEF